MLRVIIDAMPIQKWFQFLSKSYLSMMFLLTFDIFSDRINRRFAYGETGKASLPLKTIRQFKSLFNPARRIGFQFTDKLWDSHWRFNFSQKMYMVNYAVDDKDGTFLRPCNPADIAVCFFAKTVFNDAAAVLGAEDNMVKMVWKRVAHGRSLCRPLRGLKLKK